MSYDPSYTRIGFPRPTPAVGRLMLINVAVFVANMLFVGRLSEYGKDGGGRWFCVSWPMLWEGDGLGLLRLVTYQFTHSFSDPFHFLWNMVFLYMFGTIAESRIGYRGIYKLYLTGGFAGAIGHMLVYGLIEGENVPVVGASGSCFALFLYAVCVAPRLEINCILFSCQLIFLGVVFVGVALYLTYVELMRGNGSAVSHCAHLGGAAWGILVWKTGWFYDHVPAEYHRSMVARLQTWLAGRRAAQRERRTVDDQAELDRILEKVKASGMTSLTAAERSFLDRFSARRR